MKNSTDKFSIDFLLRNKIESRNKGTISFVSSNNFFIVLKCQKSTDLFEVDGNKKKRIKGRSFYNLPCLRALNINGVG